MQYLLLIHSSKTAEPAPGTDVFDEHMAGYGAFSKEVKEKGQLVAGSAVQRAGTVVRVRGGETETAESSAAADEETLSGYYLLDCESLDEATAYAAKIPSAKVGYVEVRQMLAM